MPLHKADEHVVPAQLICFLISFILVVLNLFMRGDTLEILTKMKDAFFITGTTLLAIKLTRDGWEMPAAGLIILSIGWGVVFAATDFFGQTAAVTMLSSASYFIFPAMILITFYKPFNWWIKILCWGCILNFIIYLIKNLYYPQIMFNLFIDIANLITIHIVSMAWALFFFFEHRRNKKMISS